jgi:hypothetical protein
MAGPSDTLGSPWIPLALHPYLAGGGKPVGIDESLRASHRRTRRSLGDYLPQVTANSHYNGSRYISSLSKGFRYNSSHYNGSHYKGSRYNGSH